MGSSFRAHVRAAQREAEILFGKILGVGAGTPTVAEGCKGFTVGRTGVGLLTFTFEEGVSMVAPATPGKWATTLADLDGWDIVFTAYNATTRVLTCNIINEANTLADLPAATWISPIFAVYK